MCQSQFFRTQIFNGFSTPLFFEWHSHSNSPLKNWVALPLPLLHWKSSCTLLVLLSKECELFLALLWTKVFHLCNSNSIFSKLQSNHPLYFAFTHIIIAGLSVEYFCQIHNYQKFSFKIPGVELFFINLQNFECHSCSHSVIKKWVALLQHSSI